MKRIFVIFAVFAAMFLMVACGGSTDEDNNENESGNKDDNSQECTSGEFKCIGSESYYCNSLGSLVYDARCENGCNSLTGKCITNSGGDNNDTDSGDFSDSANDNTDSDTNTDTDIDPCTEEGAFRCNGNLQQECTYGYWRTLVECEYDCDPVTQKCLGATECKTGTYECIAGNSSYCNNNFWEIKEVCQYGCSEGKCLPEDCNTTRIYTCGDSKESGFSYASYYCEYGSWHYDKTCQGDCDQSTGKCKAVCSSGEYKCEGNDSMLCKNGFWEKNKTCSYGCDSSTGECKAVCSSGEYKCEGNDSMLCNKDGFWTNYITSCTYGCDSSTGKCKPLCNAGEYRCNDSYSQVCQGNSSPYWANDKSCNFGCNSSTGKCNCPTISGKTWSEYYTQQNWKGAKNYCNNLTECGYSDWHLPTISELRTLIQDCPGTETGGKCNVTDSCTSSVYCLNNFCNGCGTSIGGHSQLGDQGTFWSSSVSDNDSGSAWYVDFSNGYVYYQGTSLTLYVRCVR